MGNEKTKLNLVRELIVVDRRNKKRLKRVTERVVVQDKGLWGYSFTARWQFPVPASLRRYFLGGRELAIEELGAEAGTNRFVFSGVFIRTSSRLK